MTWTRRYPVLHAHGEEVCMSGRARHGSEAVRRGSGTRPQRPSRRSRRRASSDGRAHRGGLTRVRPRAWAAGQLAHPSRPSTVTAVKSSAPPRSSRMRTTSSQPPTCTKRSASLRESAHRGRSWTTLPSRAIRRRSCASSSVRGRSGTPPRSQNRSSAWSVQPIRSRWVALRRPRPRGRSRAPRPGGRCDPRSRPRAPSARDWRPRASRRRRWRRSRSRARRRGRRP